MIIGFYSSAHFSLQFQELQHVTFMLVDLFKTFTGSSNLTGLGSLGIMYVKVMDGRMVKETLEAAEIISKCNYLFPNFFEVFS
ncbi:hypothetical protein P3S67_028662 [Capsicum chacoense]